MVHRRLLCRTPISRLLRRRPITRLTHVSTVGDEVLAVGGRERWCPLGSGEYRSLSTIRRARKRMDWGVTFAGCTREAIPSIVWCRVVWTKECLLRRRLHRPRGQAPGTFLRVEGLSVDVVGRTRCSVRSLCGLCPQCATWRRKADTSRGGGKPRALVCPSVNCHTHPWHVACDNNRRVRVMRSRCCISPSAALLLELRGRQYMRGYARARRPGPSV